MEDGDDSASDIATSMYIPVLQEGEEDTDRVPEKDDASTYHEEHVEEQTDIPIQLASNAVASLDDVEVQPALASAPSPEPFDKPADEAVPAQSSPVQEAQKLEEANEDHVYQCMDGDTAVTSKTPLQQMPWYLVHQRRLQQVLIRQHRREARRKQKKLQKQAERQEKMKQVRCVTAASDSPDPSQNFVHRQRLTNIKSTSEGQLLGRSSDHTG